MIHSTAADIFQIGDIVAVGGHGDGEPARLGQILEVIGAPEHVRYRVVWDDDRESILRPSPQTDIRVRRTAGPA